MHNGGYGEQKKDDAIDRLINEHQVADLIGVSVATVRRWRLQGRELRYLKIGVLVEYCPRAVQGWLKARPTGGDSDRARGRRLSSNVEQRRGLAESSQTAPPANRSARKRDDDKVLSIRADRKHVVQLWQQRRVRRFASYETLPVRRVRWSA